METKKIIEVDSVESLSNNDTIFVNSNNSLKQILKSNLTTDGKSAYAYAVEGGYTGTEAEFAALIANSGAYRVIDMTASAAELAPNTYYKWGEVAALSITLADPADTTTTNEYCFEFVSGETATMLTVPSDIKWGQAPTIEAGKTYQVSILNGVGVICGA